MAISKRVRYEILRRDGHKCRYCGVVADESPLVVDHVTPTALGGTDDPSNLVASCRDCNSGKAASKPDESLVAEVSDDALKHARLIKQAYAVLVEQVSNRDDYIIEVEDAIRELTDYRLSTRGRQSVGRWFDIGVPVRLAVDAAQRAYTHHKRMDWERRFQYMCGIVWNQVQAVTNKVTTNALLDGAWMTEEDLAEYEERAWQSGYNQGANRMQRKWDKACGDAGRDRHVLSAVVDNLTHTLPNYIKVVTADGA